MKRMRSILCCLLVLCVVATAVPVTVHAAYGNPCTLCGGSCSRFITSADPVHRLYGATRYETSFVIADTLKQHLGVSSFDSIIVASGTGFADALAGSYLASVKKAPILIANGKNNSDIQSYIKANLSFGGRVYLLGGPSALPESLENTLKDYSVKRLWGNNRYATNLAILREAGVAGKDILVCTGKGFADSLSASAVGRPILLVADKLSSEQKAFLEGTSGNKIIIGGTGAVNTTVESQLKAYGTVERIGGNTRYETSVLVAQRFFSAPTHGVVAYAGNFPDGLCGGPLAYSLGAPLILTASGKESVAAAYTTKQDISKGYVLGGSKLISDSAVGTIFTPPRKQSETRKSYDVGNCRDLEGSPFVIVFFLDDNESSWDDEKLTDYWYDQIIPGLEFIEKWAGTWGKTLDFQGAYYDTNPDQNRTLKYNGTIYGDLSMAQYNRDVLDQIAVSLGFGTKEAMDEFLQEYSGEDDIVYLVMVNKPGRSYSYNDETNDGNDMLEHCMVFANYASGTELVPSTVAHEIFHLFGAEDYYDPYGYTPNRHALAEEIYHDDIMLRVYTSEEYNNVGAFTAYTVGWTHKLPPECDCPEWWS